MIEILSNIYVLMLIAPIVYGILVLIIRIWRTGKW